MEKKEYIEREAAINKACEGCNVEFGDEPCEPSDCYIRNKLLAAPATDVAPVVHGRWIEEKKQTLIPVEFDDAGEPVLYDYVVYRCDQCGRTTSKKEPYCHCGAKMDLK